MTIYKIYRAIDGQALLGNIGGYIGLCLGYSILHIPDLILLIMRKLKKYYSELRPGRDSIGPMPLRIVVLENQLNNRPDSKANNSELDNNDVIRSIQIELKKITEKMDK